MASTEIHFKVPDMYVKDYKNEFKDRRRTLLDALNTVEKEFASSSLHNRKQTKSSRSSTSPSRSQTRAFRGKESIFKVPDEPMNRRNLKRLVTKSMSCNTGRAPGKWTKYSLENVSDADMSESANTSAAFSFLQEIRDRKIADSEDSAMDVEDANFKPTFKKPTAEIRKVNFQTTRRSKDETTNALNKDMKATGAETTSKDGTSRPKVTLNHLNYDDCD